MSDLVSKQSEINTIFYTPSGDEIILVLDGTHVSIQESSNFKFQRDMYCGNKHQNLIKPMIAVFTDGYIGEFFGSYPTRIKDASILNKLLEMDA